MCDVRVGRAHSVEGRMGHTERTEHIDDMLGHALGQAIVLEYEVQKITVHIPK